MKNEHCCRLDEEFICGIIRHRAGIDEGDLDYQIRRYVVDNHIDEIIAEVKCLLEKLNEIKGEKTKWQYQ